jgi:hypothetical protein
MDNQNHHNDCDKMRRCVGCRSLKNEGCVFKLIYSNSTVDIPSSGRGVASETGFFQFGCLQWSREFTSREWMGCEDIFRYNTKQIIMLIINLTASSEAKVEAHSTSLPRALSPPAWISARVRVLGILRLCDFIQLASAPPRPRKI